jgi:hypothetical protein
VLSISWSSARGRKISPSYSSQVMARRPEM